MHSSYKYFFILLSFLFLQACKNKDTFLNMPIPEEMKDNGKANYYNQDNLIYKPGKTFLFRTYFYNENGKEQVCELQPSQIKAYSSESQYYNWQDEIHYAPYIVKYLSLECYKNISNMYSLVDNEQTINKFEILNSDKDRILNIELTGIMEKKDTLFMHSPRIGCFDILQCAPFPVWFAPAQAWDHQFYIPKETLQFNVSDTITEDIMFDISYKKMEDVVLENKAIKHSNIKICTHIHAIAFNEKLKSEADFYFHPEYGLVKADYKTINHKRIVLELESLIEQ